MIDQRRMIHNPWPPLNVACHFMKARLGRVCVCGVDSLDECFSQFLIAAKSLNQITNCNMGVPAIQSVHASKRGHLFSIGCDDSTAGAMPLFFPEISPAGGQHETGG